MRVAFDLQARGTDPCDAQHLANVLATKVAYADVLCFALVDEALHRPPSCSDVILHEDHFTVHILPLGRVLLIEWYKLVCRQKCKVREA